MKAMTLDNLKSLTDSIKAGEKVVLFPPGILSLVAIVILMIAATVTLFGSLISIFANDVDTPVKAGIQFMSMIFLFLFVILPGLMVFQGNKKFSSWTFLYANALIVLSLLLFTSNLLNLFDAYVASAPIIVSLICSLTSLFILQSNSFTLLKEFFYYLKKC